MTIRKLSIVALLICSVLGSAYGVTREEMEKARTITAKIYLRWANNGSDYLDSKNPSTLSELESGLRDKEKSNLQAFKNIPVPSDFASWDKNKLVEYWSKTALSSPGLNPDGVRGGAKSQIKSKLSAMSVTPPAADEPAEQPADAKESAAENQNDIPDELTEISDVEQEAEASLDSTQASDSLASPVKKEGSSTWIYVVALALLVIAVVALVVYASKNMNKNNNSQPGSSSDRRDTKPLDKSGSEAPRKPSPAPSQPQSPSYNNTAAESYTVASDDAPYQPAPAADAGLADDAQRMREKFAETLADKQEEIRLLNRQVCSLTEENRSLTSQIEVLRLENERLQREKEEMMTGGVSRLAAPAPGRVSGVAAAAQRPAQQGQSRDIYLGRVNSKGLFVRADRNFNPGNSIYVLHTSDGFTGTFYIADHSSVPDLVFPRPQEMLAGGCVAMDITDTRGRSRIRTEAPGTAIFENNCWRVTRKARIRYE